MDAKRAIEIRTVRQNYYDEITADGNCDRCCRVCIECGHNNEKQRAETEQFYKDVNVQTCKEHFEIMTKQSAYIEQQDKERAGLQQRLREFDEKIQTQAMVLDARDKIIVRQGQEATRMQRMIDKAVGMLARITDRCAPGCQDIENNECEISVCHEKCARGWRKWLEQEAGE